MPENRFRRSSACRQLLGKVKGRVLYEMRNRERYSCGRSTLTFTALFDDDDTERENRANFRGISKALTSGRGKNILIVSWHSVAEFICESAIFDFNITFLINRER